MSNSSQRELALELLKKLPPRRETTVLELSVPLRGFIVALFRFGRGGGIVQLEPSYLGQKYAVINLETRGEAPSDEYGGLLRGGYIYIDAIELGGGSRSHLIRKMSIDVVRERERTENYVHVPPTFRKRWGGVQATLEES